MTKKITYTSTLPEDVLDIVNDYSEINHISKNQVVEKALRQFFFKVKQEDFREGFKRAAGDAEMNDLARAGINDYLDILKQNDPEGT